MNISIEKDGLWTVEDNVDCISIDEDKILIINLEEIAKSFVDDNRGCGMVDGDSLDHDIRKFTDGMFMDILDYALAYAEEECFEVRYSIL